MDDAGVRRDDLEVAERGLPPAEERVALAVALELELRVPSDCEPRRVLVDLHRVIDHELGGKQRVDLLGVAAELAHRVAHRREVDDRGDAREVLEQDSRGRERDLARRLRLRVPSRNGLDVLVVTEPKDVLEQDLQRVREPLDVELLLERAETEDLVGLAADAESRARAKRVGDTPNVSTRR